MILQGKDLRRVRETYGFTQTEVAEKMKISRSYISGIEGETQKYSQEKFIQVLNAIYSLYKDKNK